MVQQLSEVLRRLVCCVAVSTVILFLSRGRKRTAIVRPRAPDAEEERQVRDDRCGGSARNGTRSRRRTDEHERRSQRRDERPDVEALAMARNAVRGVRAQLSERRGGRKLRRRDDERDLRDAID